MGSGRALVIGYGNPLRGDDGLGWRAAELLQARLPEAEVIICQQMTPELAEPLSRAQRAAFVDVAVDRRPGSLAVEPLAPQMEAGLSFTHHFSPGILLSLAQKLYGHAPEAVLFSLGGQSFDHSETLSAPVAAALPELVRQVEAWVSQAP